ncbi:family 20 glycosylhydrolase [Flagellimonas sp. 389]|uniref:family 20 glycosylhydrolase n=1 Tax=Flagellimonas sp. 389 TaxID=2835862 RepID=UPI001BD3678C|nr:family 20 glycosylhydrolase [Flagellimonas sp. 389]MBS9461549.1 family 20 glycosylhydrolase [Flagellimonas sp. 389]
MLSKALLILSVVTFIAACQPQKEEINFPKTDLAVNALIPKPLKVVPTHTAFGLSKNTVILTSSANTELEEVGLFLSNKIKSKIGLDIDVNIQDSEKQFEQFIYINLSDSVDLDSPESYQLYIKKDSIFLNAKTVSGAFRGVQTIRQLIPEKSNDTLTDYPLWPVPSGKIWDKPKFEYRGAMLDVARHFFSVEDVKKYMDILAYYKYNVLHLHLSDDQGWRIEIKSWPKLTQIGSKTEVGGGKGGFYTQENYKELVKYAAERFITIIPEIDMPGHTNAASVSYPFLNGNGKKIKPYTGMRVGFSTFDTRKDTVYSFLDDVIGEIANITPGPYFHIGGDESFVTKKRDYNYFIERVEDIVQKHGKQMIGWDEIAHSKIDSTTIAQHWRTASNALKASKNNSKVILSPGKKAYLDMKYDSLSKYGLDWAGHIPVDVAYNWNPETYVPGLPKEAILGIEAPLWSETISTIEELEYLAFPRAIGYAELGWSTSEYLNWEDYKERLAKQLPFLDMMNVKYYPTKLVDWEK